jgi:hypothetical protein
MLGEGRYFNPERGRGEGGGGNSYRSVTCAGVRESRTADNRFPLFTINTVAFIQALRASLPLPLPPPRPRPSSSERDRSHASNKHTARRDPRNTRCLPGKK